MNIQDAYLQNVQATYRYYCYHVNNMVQATDDDDESLKGTSSNLKWIPSKLHTFICNTLQDFIERKTGKPVEILILNTPPQIGKSTTLTETLPSWFLLRNPDKQVIEVSYGDDLAERFGKRNLEKVKEFGSLFGVSVDKKKATSKEFQIADHKGRMISRGIGSALTGYSGDLIVIDDPIKNRQEADSQSRREFIWNEFLNSIYTRTQAHSKIILVMTRWHEDDLAGRLLDDPEFAKITTYINIPCEAEENDPLGREVGDAICPEIGKGNEWLKNFKPAYTSQNGLRAWNALYQGRPTALEGNMLKREWWQFYERSDYDNGDLKFNQMIMTVDATFKDEAKNDYVAIGVWAKSGIRIYMVDMFNEHLNFASTIRRIKEIKALYSGIGAILVEDKANGSAIIQVLRNEIPGIIPVTPDASKESRVNAVSFAIEAGNVYLPKDKNITWEFIDQCSAFPNGKHDDMVDSMSMGVHRLVFTKAYKRQLEKTQVGDGFFKFVKEKKKSLGRGDKIKIV